MACAATIANKQVLFVMAVENEYGPHLKTRFDPLMIGVGPVEAALNTDLALQQLDQDRNLPDLVVSLGSAGSRVCAVGDVYQVASVSWRDMDASRLGFPKGVTPFSDHPAELPLHTPLELRAARLSTGANIVGGEDYAAIDADMVDMETFAVVRACQRFSVPVMGLRGISDGPGELSDMLGWTQLLALLDQRLAEAVDMLADALRP
ncbi:5'-methylthioadenosine/S-adenosylhomocysteine nucleosidase [Sphingobium estronivorans]|uniref:5'-methylthioadenosine/S-adenosylhomocysteine nucleosidase n=1 Tax=Sphingobium estronivorans TaxID=1577690 RepID=UPI00123A8F29|nr:5'-methylthioadenosine/S-adenosylhomocysteine nucleosidase [Sphingobium estronivorans]